MKPKIFTGAATALITPMNEDGSVNFTQLKALVKSQIAAGIDALVACGTTGEKSTLKYDEHLKVIETVVNAAENKVPVIAGTGSNDTIYTLELCNDAQSLGADAFLMVTPYYNKASQEGLIAHYGYIADRVNKPIILYNVPSRTGVDIKPQTYKALSKHKNIVAVKEASGDLSKVAETVYLCGDDLWVYSGNDDQIVPIMSLGGLGIISVISNILPTEIHNLCQNYWVGNVKTAKNAQVKYMGLIKALFCDVNPVPVKTAMNLMGLNAGPCRLPLYPMNESNFAFLKEKLFECNLLS